jgi:hypothetical protein
MVFDQEQSGCSQIVDSQKMFGHTCIIIAIQDKTSKSFFRHTVSTFKNSAMEWSSTVQKNKSSIREFDEQKKD